MTDYSTDLLNEGLIWNLVSRTRALEARWLVQHRDDFGYQSFLYSASQHAALEFEIALLELDGLTWQQPGDRDSISVAMETAYAHARKIMTLVIDRLGPSQTLRYIQVIHPGSLLDACRILTDVSHRTVASIVSRGAVYGCSDRW